MRGGRCVIDPDPRLLEFFSDSALLGELHRRERIRKLYCQASIDHHDLAHTELDIKALTRETIFRQMARHLLDNDEIVKFEEKDHPDEKRTTLQARVLVVTNPSLPTV